MYYEEKWIEGRLCYRHIPNGGWTEFDISMYRQALDDLRHQVKKCDLADVGKQRELLTGYHNWLLQNPTKNEGWASIDEYLASL
jgi:hypothetical protein